MILVLCEHFIAFHSVLILVYKIWLIRDSWIVFLICPHSRKEALLNFILQKLIYYARRAYIYIKNALLMDSSLFGSPPCICSCFFFEFIVACNFLMCFRSNKSRSLPDYLLWVCFLYLFSHSLMALIVLLVFRRIDLSISRLI